MERSIVNYIAYLPQQNGYLVWDNNVNQWRATQDKAVATKQSYEDWIAVRANITQKFKVIKAS